MLSINCFLKKCPKKTKAIFYVFNKKNSVYESIVHYKTFTKPYLDYWSFKLSSRILKRHEQMKGSIWREHVIYNWSEAFHCLCFTTKLLFFIENQYYQLAEGPNLSSLYGTWMTNAFKITIPKSLGSFISFREKKIQFTKAFPTC